MKPDDRQIKPGGRVGPPTVYYFLSPALILLPRQLNPLPLEVRASDRGASSHSNLQRPSNCEKSYTVFWIQTPEAQARGTIPAFVAGLWPLAILVASLWNPNSYWKLNSYDYGCGAFSALALVLWAITKEPNVAIAFAIASDFFAALPTLIKAWRFPETELWWTYMASSFSGLTGVIAASSFAFSQVAFPSYLFVMMGLIGLAASRRAR
jgi:hypothetical protein